MASSRPRGGRPRPPPSSSSQEPLIPPHMDHDALFSLPLPVSKPRSRKSTTMPGVEPSMPSSISAASNVYYHDLSSGSFEWMPPPSPGSSPGGSLAKDEDNGMSMPLLLPSLPPVIGHDSKHGHTPLLASQESTHSDPFVLPPSSSDLGSNLSLGPCTVSFDVDYNDSDEMGLQSDIDSPPSAYRRRGSKPYVTAQCSSMLPPTSAKLLKPQQRHSYSPLFYTSKEFDSASPPKLPRTQSGFSALSSMTKAHPFGNRFKDFEVPQWKNLGWHVLLCALAYPFLLMFVIIAKSRSMFWTRVFIGAGCGLLGVALGVNLLRLARGIIEASTWATIIHQSRVPDGAGVRLKDLAAQTDDPSSGLTALRLIWDRQQYPGADREHRKFYDARPWSFWIFFFLANVAVSAALPFLLGRVVSIEIHIVHQHEEYYETAVKGDLSETDLFRAFDLLPAWENFAITWTLAPFSLHGGLPPVISFPWGANDSTVQEQVYFSEVILSQLMPNGSGFGTFETATMAPTTNLTGAARTQIGPKGIVNSILELGPGSIIRFPRWGIRIRCAKIPDAYDNIVPLSENNYTYLFTPRDTIRTLFDALEMPFPEDLEKPWNISTTVHVDDTLPSGLDIEQTAMGAMFWNNGVAHSLKSTPLSMGKDGKGFITLENILVRLNTTYAPYGSFPVLSSASQPDKDGNPTYIGYDAAVCLQLYEPWVLEVYNSSVGVPTSMKIINKGPEVMDRTDKDAIFIREKRKGDALNDKRWDGPISRALNSTAMRDVYIAGHQNSVNQILKDNGRDDYYVPSPTLVSFTSGEGPYGYTELSETYYAKARALADASNVLPYFAGSGLSLARQYRDKEVTSATINNRIFMGIIVGVFLMGWVSAFFVPRLPLDVPRRGFDLYSWMTAFASNELVSEKASGLDKQMDLRDIIEHAGDLKFRYVA